MGPRGKILASFLLIIVVIIAVWQFTTPVLIPPVGTKYLSSTQYANRGSWVVLEVSGYGKVFLAFSISNLTYPRTTLPTVYSLIVSKLNETVLPRPGRPQGIFPKQHKLRLSSTSRPRQTTSSGSP